jgi:hypothetical protein
VGDVTPPPTPTAGISIENSINVSMKGRYHVSGECHRGEKMQRELRKLSTEEACRIGRAGTAASRLPDRPQVRRCRDGTISDRRVAYTELIDRLVAHENHSNQKMAVDHRGGPGWGGVRVHADVERSDGPRRQGHEVGSASGLRTATA